MPEKKTTMNLRGKTHDENSDNHSELKVWWKNGQHKATTWYSYNRKISLLKRIRNHLTNNGFVKDNYFDDILLTVPETDIVWSRSAK